MSFIAVAIGGGALAGTLGSIFSSSTQANASKNAANLQATEAQNALNFQEGEYANQQQQLAPYLQTGRAGLSELGYLMGVPGAYNGGGALPAYTGGGVTSPQFNATASPGTFSAAPGTATAPATGARGPIGTSVNGVATRPGSIATGPRAGATLGNANTNQAQPPAGANGLPSSLGSLGGYGSLTAPFSQQFQAPTLAQAEQYPGYQFQLGQGQNAIENSAAARGGLVSGNEATALNNYSQGAAQSDYNNVYNEAMQQYLNSYNIYNQNQANTYNRLASLAGLGQTSVQQLGNAGQAAAGNVGNISLGAGSQIGQSLQNAGAATASGYVGAANAASGGLGNLSNLALYQQAGLLGNAANASNSGVYQNYGPQIPGDLGSEQNYYG